MPAGCFFRTSALAAFAALIGADAVHGAQLFADDVIMQGSLCTGTDCAISESFGFDTIRLKENNLRIRFEDTSASGGFPATDWQITINDTANGGASFFGIEDVDGGTMPVRVSAGAPSDSLVTDGQGNLGLGTRNPMVEVHMSDGDSPTLRLEQNGSSGWTPQVWDIAANEANFFVRDVTSGSTLPFRIRPGAPSDSLSIDRDGDVGMGTDSPASQLHVRATSAGGVGNDTGDVGHFLVENTNATAAVRTLAALRNNGDVSLNFLNTATNTVWKLASLNGAFTVLSPVTPGIEFAISNTGNVTASGNVTAASFRVGAQTLNVPDYVFDDEYPLASLSEVEAFVRRNRHLPDVPSEAMLNETGLDLPQMQMILLRKVEELTLYTIAQQHEIAELRAQLSRLE